MVRRLFFLRTILYSLFLPCNLGACPPRSTINWAFRLIDNDFCEGVIEVIVESIFTDWGYRSRNIYYLEVRYSKESVIFNCRYTRGNRILCVRFWWGLKMPEAYLPRAWKDMLICFLFQRYSVLLQSSDRWSCSRRPGRNRKYTWRSSGTME